MHPDIQWYIGSRGLVDRLKYTREVAYNGHSPPSTQPQAYDYRVVIQNVI